LLVGMILGLVGWINQQYIADQWHWWTVTRTYMLSEVRPHVLAVVQEQALKPKDSFRECAKYCPEMVVVPPGEFTMGSPLNEQGRRNDEGPQHKVKLAEPFAVSKYEVTFSEWDACVNYGNCDARVSDSNFGHGSQPLINITWEDAQRYVAWFSKMTGKAYRLLTEAEWEYAARGGTQTAYFWGDDIGKGNANCAACGSRWDDKQPAAVGSFAANAFGLHDMVGNVWEWVQDCYLDSYNGAPNDGSARTDTDCRDHVARGGSWRFFPQEVRVAARERVASDTRYYEVGVRVGRRLAR
jgi:formylglycine-generating enzyme required for sulfatase activity